MALPAVVPDTLYTSFFNKSAINKFFWEGIYCYPEMSRILVYRCNDILSIYFPERGFQKEMLRDFRAMVTPKYIV